MEWGLIINRSDGLWRKVNRGKESLKMFNQPIREGTSVCFSPCRSWPQWGSEKMIRGKISIHGGNGAVREIAEKGAIDSSLGLLWKGLEPASSVGLAWGGGGGTVFKFRGKKSLRHF